MPAYAVKIGEIHIRSDKAISEEQRKQLVRDLLATGHFESVDCGENTEVVFHVREGNK